MRYQPRIGGVFKIGLLLQDFGKIVFTTHLSSFLCSLFAVLVRFPELTFRLQPVVQVAAVNSPARDVDLEGSLTDFRWRRSTLLFLFCDVGLRYDLRHTLCIREKIA